eukprot:1723445-Prorocentrum_lima.AAC.1
MGFGDWIVPALRAAWMVPLLRCCTDRSDALCTLEQRRAASTGISARTVGAMHGSLSPARLPLGDLG